MTGGLGLLAIYGPHMQTGPKAERLTSLARSQVNHIRLQRPGQDTVTLRREGRNWHVTAPITARANPIRAAALASLAGASSNIVYATTAIRPDALGLGATALVLHLNDISLRIGTREEVRDLRYVQNAGRVFLVQDRFYHHVSATTAGFVDPVLIDPTRRIASVRTPRFELESTESGLRWRPQTAFASADDAAAWLARWHSLSALAVSFADYSAKWHPAMTVRFESGHSEQFVYRSAHGRVWIAQPEVDLQYEIPTSRAKALGLVKP
jgi:hypothetical protein